MLATMPPFLKYFELGYKRLVPIVPPDAELSPKSSLYKRPNSRGKAVGVKGRDGLWRGYDWLRAPAPTVADLEEWAAMGAGVGIRTGAGLVALDIDSLDPKLARDAEWLAFDMLDSSAVRYGKRPKRLLVYRTVEAVPYMRVEFTGHDGKNERIELLSDDRQFVAWGTHATTGQPYEWEGDLPPFEDLPLVDRAELDAYFDRLSKTLPAATKVAALSASPDRANIDQNSLTGDPELVAAAVAALPNTSSFAPTYDDYIRVGAAIKGATQDDPDTGLQLFLDWAERWEDGENDLEVAESDYRRIKPPFELGARWLFDMADRHSDGQFSNAKLWLQPIEPNTNPFLTDVSEEPATAKASRRFELVPFDTAADNALTDTAQPLIKGLLDQGAMTVLYGASNTGKTFVAMDIAFHIATGRNWAGMRTHQAPVVYVAAEGGRGAKKRAQALRLKYQAKDVPFYLLMDSVDLLRPDADLQPLISAIAGISGEKPGLIVLDTLSRVMAGGDENSSTDMGALVKHMDALRSATAAHVLTVHHSGKDSAKGARGHSLLRAATDTEIEIADGQIAVTKQRDMDGSFSTLFSLESHQLGVDADGDPVTSCTVLLGASAGAGEAPVETLAPKEREMFEAIALLIETSDAPEKGVTVKQIAAFAQDNLSGMNEKSTRRLIEKLGAKKLIVRTSWGKYGLKFPPNGLGEIHFDPVEENAIPPISPTISPNFFD